MCPPRPEVEFLGKMEAPIGFLPQLVALSLWRNAESCRGGGGLVGSWRRTSQAAPNSCDAEQADNFFGGRSNLLCKLTYTRQKGSNWRQGGVCVKKSRAPKLWFSFEKVALKNKRPNRLVVGFHANLGNRVEPF